MTQPRGGAQSLSPAAFSPRVSATPTSRPSLRGTKLSPQCSRTNEAPSARRQAMSDLDTTATRAWTIEAVQQLVELAREGVPVPVISLKLKRSITAVREKLAEIGVRAPAIE
jgi:hypothetical protein